MFVRSLVTFLVRIGLRRLGVVVIVEAATTKSDSPSVSVLAIWLPIADYFRLTTGALPRANYVQTLQL
jgi:hypothetical protein